MYTNSNIEQPRIKSWEENYFKWKILIELELVYIYGLKYRGNRGSFGFGLGNYYKRSKKTEGIWNKQSCTISFKFR